MACQTETAVMDNFSWEDNDGSFECSKLTVTSTIYKTTTGMLISMQVDSMVETDATADECCAEYGETNEPTLL